MIPTRRRAQPDDVAFLEAIFLTSMREAITAARGYWDPVKEGAQFRQQLELDGTDVIQSAGSDVGFVSARRGPSAIVVNTLCVAEEHRGRGLGAEIMRQFMAEASAAGAGIEVFVLKTNPRARALYARLGFADAGQLPHHFRMAWPVAG
jgi:ribosomal protein S18 acetylase RimI-like enzyme